MGRGAGADRDGAGAERDRALDRAGAGRDALRGELPVVTHSRPPEERPPEKMRAEGLRAWFVKAEALRGITLPLAQKRVTAIIGPSGCGKSTFVRCLNRM